MRDMFNVLEDYEYWLTGTMGALYGDLSSLWQKAFFAASIVLFSFIVARLAMARGVWSLPGAAAALILAGIAGYSIPLVMVFVLERMGL